MMPSKIDNGTASSSVDGGEVERRRQAVEHDREGRHPLPDRFTEVAPRHAADEAAELDQDRIVETEPLAHGLALLLGGLRPQHQAGRVADEVRHEEDDHDQTQQDEQGMNEPAQQIGADGRVLLREGALRSGGSGAVRGVAIAQGGEEGETNAAFSFVLLALSPSGR